MPSVCTITGVVYGPSLTPVANATITFDSVVVQTVMSGTIAPVVISTTTDANGMLAPISLVQGLSIQVTINNFAPTAALVPYASSVDFSDLLDGVATFNPGFGAFTQITLFCESAPLPSQTCQALIYLDNGDNTVKMSVNGGAFYEMLTAGSNLSPIIANNPLDPSTTVSTGGSDQEGNPWLEAFASDPGSATGANTTETTLVSAVLHSNYFNQARQVLVIEAYVNFALNTNNKTYRLKFGSNTVSIAGPNAFQGPGMLRTMIFADSVGSSGVFRVYNYFSGFIGAPGVANAATLMGTGSGTTYTVNTLNDIIVEITGENGTASANDIVQHLVFGFFSNVR